MLERDPNAAGPLVDVFRRPNPLLAAGRALAPIASAMMDVSDGLLIDADGSAKRAVAVEIDLDALPLSPDFVAARGDGLHARMFAATGGDDYALLLIRTQYGDIRTFFTSRKQITRVGQLVAGRGLSLSYRGDDVPTPERLGYEHRGT